MVSFTQAIALTAAISAVSALPADTSSGHRIPLRRREDSVADKIANSANAGKALVGKYTATLNAYKQNTGEDHPASKLVSTKTKRQSEPLKPQESGALWTGDITIGSNKQKFTVDFDTGSSDLWVPDASCSDEACTSHNTYDSSASSSSKKADGTFQIQYGDGSGASGPEYTDDVTVSGLTAKGQKFASVTKDSLPSDDPSDGIAGMGFDTISQLKSPPFFQTLSSSGAAKSGVFTFYLDKGSDAALYLGGTGSLTSGDVTYVPVDKKGYWQVTGSINVGGKSVLSDVTTIIDTGTSLIVGTPDLISKLMDGIDGAKACDESTCGQGSDGLYTIPCDTKVSAVFNKAEWDFSSTFSIGNVDDSTCIAGVQGVDGVPVDGLIMGDTFLSSVAAVFDLDNSQVGFAKPA